MALTFDPTVIQLLKRIYSHEIIEKLLEAVEFGKKIGADFYAPDPQGIVPMLHRHAS